MKLTLLLVTVLCLALVVFAEEGTENGMSQPEIQELIDGYKDLNKDGPNQPVSLTFSESKNIQNCFLTDSRNGHANEGANDEVLQDGRR